MGGVPCRQATSYNTEAVKNNLIKIWTPENSHRSAAHPRCKFHPMRANIVLPQQPCSTTGRSLNPSYRSRERCRHVQTYAKQDTFCKDVVNVTKKVNTEGSSRISFMGAEGHEIQIDCPKVTPGTQDSGLSVTILDTYTCRC